jgi:hypothetical protein
VHDGALEHRFRRSFEEEGCQGGDGQHHDHDGKSMAT